MGTDNSGSDDSSSDDSGSAGPSEGTRQAGDTERFRDGSGWQDIAGYSRAVRRGDVIAVSGTTANIPGSSAATPGDTAEQLRDCLRAVLAAVAALGGRPEDIIRTRILLTPDADWEAASRVHGEVFAAILPANSMYRVAGLLGEGFLVEVEADAIVRPA